MKKLSILFAGILVSAMIFTSCSKDDDAKVTVTTGKATVTGYVYLLSDATANTTTGVLDVAAHTQYAPSGTQITLKIDTDDLVQGTNNVNHPEKVYYGKVGSDGKYSISVDAGANPVIVTMLQGTELELNYSRNIYSGGSTHDTTYAQHWTSSNAAGFSLVQKHTEFKNLTYSGTAIH